MGEPTADELIERWVRGEASAGEALCRRYLGRAREFARRIAGREMDPDELASEALEAGLEGLRAGKRPDRFTLWLHGVLRNLVRRRIRDRKKAASLEGTDLAATSGGLLTQLANRELVRLMDDLVPRLPSGSREVIELFRQGRTREEIAAAIGVPIDAVHARFQRAFRAMREGLSRHFTTMVVAGPPGPVRWEEIRKLRPSFREAVVACHLDGISKAEAARRLGVPPDTIDARLQTAYETLRCDDRSDFGPARDEYRREAGPHQK